MEKSCSRLSTFAGKLGPILKAKLLMQQQESVYSDPIGLTNYTDGGRFDNCGPTSCQIDF